MAAFMLGARMRGVVRGSMPAAVSVTLERHCPDCCDLGAVPGDAADAGPAAGSPEQQRGEEA